MIARVVTINHLTSFLKVLVEDDEDLQDLWVDGEISNLTIARSGHAYFTLKDETSQLGAVMWRTALGRQRMVPREGDRVIAHGNISFYQPQGKLQLVVDVLQPQGTGILQLKLEELRQKLEAEGMFEESRKRPLPGFPRKIGVVTSATGAVWHDIQHVIARRYPLVELTLAPAIVQGDQAPDSLVEALAYLQDTVAPDVIIIGRGGGSLEDLWAFNDERVVRSIFASRVPVISAVGHETDITLADYVADMRAPTPSAAAELAVPDLAMIDQGLAELQDRLHQCMDRRIQEAHQLVDDLHSRLNRVSPSASLRVFANDLVPLRERLDHAVKSQLRLAKHDVEAFSDILDALNPQALMARGFSFVCNAENGKAIKSTADVNAGDTIRAILSDGELRADVSDVKQNDEGPPSTGVQS